MNTRVDAAIAVKATTVKGSVDLVKRCHARGDAFLRFNDGFVRVFRKLPAPVLTSSVGCRLSEFFASGASKFAGAFLVNVEFFEAAMTELGLDAVQHLKSELPA